MPDANALLALNVDGLIIKIGSTLINPNCGEHISIMQQDVDYWRRMRIPIVLDGIFSEQDAQNAVSLFGAMYGQGPLYGREVSASRLKDELS